MSGVLTNLKTRLVSAGVTTPIALGRLPDLPDALIALREYPAEPSRDITAAGRPVLERFAVQMITRAARDDGAQSAESLAWTAYRALAGRHVTIGTARYDWIMANAVPALLGRDANDRPLAVVNWSLQRHGDVA